jgi:type IV pilus assembly protein PilP
MMGKNPVIMRYLISTICIVLLLWGCDRTIDATAQPKVVRKKVVAQKERTAKVTTKQTVPKVSATPTARPEKKMAAEKVDIAKARKQPTPKTKTGRKIVIAKKIEVAPVKETESNPLKQKNPPMQKKPAIRPRSEISEIRQTQTGDKTVPSDKLIAATSNVTRATKPGTIPGVYNGNDKIDPFQPLINDKPVTVKKDKRKKRMPMTPLERIDLSQLKLVGIIMASSGNRALVEESSGKGYVVKKGTYIGANSGKVVKIRKEKVVVEEEFEDVFGKTKVRQREIRLPKPPGEF